MQFYVCLQNALHGNYYKLNKHTWYPNYFTYYACPSLYDTCITVQQ